MSLKQKAVEKLDELRVASLWQRNTQLSPGRDAITRATIAQPNGLKALAANDCERNIDRNNCATTPEKETQLSPLKTPLEVAHGCAGFSDGCAPALEGFDANAEHSRSGGGLTVTDRQRAYLKREPLVSEAELHKIQRQLMRHLIDCRDCIVDLHRYCIDGERTGNGYEAFLAEFPDAEQWHEVFVSAIIRARCSGLQAGFASIEIDAHLQSRWAGLP